MQPQHGNRLNMLRARNRQRMVAPCVKFLELLQVDLTPLEFQSARFLKGEQVFVVLRQGLEDYSI